MEWQFGGGQPLYAQIVRLLKRRIASGTLRPGERLPAVRELAMEAGVNPNTMQRSLSDLEREGLVYAQRTSGRFVTEDASRLDELRRELAEADIRAFLASMGELGYSTEDIMALIGSFQKEEE